MKQHQDSIRTAPVRVVDTHAGRLPEYAPADWVSRRPIYRPLIIGPAVLHRVGASGTSADAHERRTRQPWQVTLIPGSRLRPRAPRTVSGIERMKARCRRAGCVIRIGAALVSCCDISEANPALSAGPGPNVPPTADREPGMARPENLPGNPPPAPRFRFDAPRRGCVAEIYGWALMYQLPGMIDRAAVDPHDEFDDLPAYYESPLELVDRSAFLAARGIPSRPIALLTRPHDFAPDGAGGARLVNVHFPQTRFRQPADLRRIF